MTKLRTEVKAKFQEVKKRAEKPKFPRFGADGKLCERVRKKGKPRAWRGVVVHERGKF